jgi:hypothetical protein
VVRQQTFWPAMAVSIWPNADVRGGETKVRFCKLTSRAKHVEVSKMNEAEQAALRAIRQH